MSSKCLFRLGRNLFCFALLALCAVTSFAGDEERQVKSQAKPVYPELARRMNLTGIVKVQVQIAPNGTVTSAAAIGGSPVFLEAALEAAKKFRFEPAPSATSQVVTFNFVKPNGN